MAEANTIESRFIFKQTGAVALNYISDGEGQKLGFSKTDEGNNIIFTKDLEGIDVAIEHYPDGTKVFHMEKDSKGLPAMHEFKPDGTEYIYLFDAAKRLEKMVEMKTNGDKVTTWFSIKGESITQEQRQQGGILFSMSGNGQKAMIWLRVDGSIESNGYPMLIAHIKIVFSKFLDGLEA
ncbi:MAG: hypothetical protein O3C63_04460 [Cyanobacteria bacterium]|nr:hypothetical protein [Cyanobacteriota bacterium]MDA1020770.1 hypothetical protein [Cyanobacteriota bacterium]